MKVRLLRDAPQRNPDYDPTAAKDRKANWPTRTVVAGTEIEHPDAWMLCLPVVYAPGRTEEALAEPIDEEATAKVTAALEQRREAIEARSKRRQKEALGKAKAKARRKAA